MRSHISPQTHGTRFATGSLNMLTASAAPGKTLADGRAALLFDEPTASGHYHDMHVGPAAWDGSYDDEERPRD